MLEDITEKKIEYACNENTWRLVNDETKNNQLLGPLSSLVSYCMLPCQSDSLKKRILFGMPVNIVKKYDLERRDDKVLQFFVLSEGTGEPIPAYEIRLVDEKNGSLLLSRIVLSAEVPQNVIAQKLEVLVRTESPDCLKGWEKSITDSVLVQAVKEKTKKRNFNS